MCYNKATKKRTPVRGNPHSVSSGHSRPEELLSRKGVKEYEKSEHLIRVASAMGRGVPK